MKKEKNQCLKTPAYMLECECRLGSNILKRFLEFWGFTNWYTVLLFIEPRSVNTGTFSKVWGKQTITEGDAHLAKPHFAKSESAIQESAKQAPALLQ